MVCGITCPSFFAGTKCHFFTVVRADSSRSSNPLDKKIET
jgi:hypothetical protein